MERVDSLPSLPPRDPAGHKGTFGSVLVIGGHAANPVMLGGPALAARAALRAGCGLCTLAMPEPLLAQALSVAASATGCALPVDAQGHLHPSAAAEILDPALARASAVVAGPGLGGGFAVQQLVVRLASSVDVPLVLDADALNALAVTADFAGDLKAPIVITPHPGEFARLAEALGLEVDGVDPARRERAAVAMAARLGCVTVLKGAGTVVSDGVRAWTCASIEPALATGGSGDALSGVLGGLAAQFARPASPHRLGLFEVACLAVQLHADSAERWAGRHGHAGMLAEEIADGIPDAMAARRA
jgi:NAD(P)H-hydrate epimerase